MHFLKNIGIIALEWVANSGGITCKHGKALRYLFGFIYLFLLVQCIFLSQ